MRKMLHPKPIGIFGELKGIKKPVLLVFYLPLYVLGKWVKRVR